ncbi:peroxiredoxin family protein [Adhaeribacter radiodurans]|uniref:TlpA family protein disulfide reductase n=1 Tax=Adhaeribacter radiodurans TaxID=2745197 RepID=A0A7L7LC45_9BACT|nr:TlpA disulfide reductase family protein [Adhaeribacter radiodurans]QMU29949.1 TlpA family protein disulfide reductase [Adhaeribacter radiodurans]
MKSSASLKLYPYIFALLILFFAFGCKPEPKVLKPGMWRAVLTISNQELPFLMQVVKQQDGKTVAYLINGEEKILLDEISIDGDSVKIPLHIFDADLKAHINDQQDGMKGKWTRYHLEEPYQVSFSAKLGQDYRFSKKPKPATYNYTGKWDVLFKYDDGTEEKAVGVFEQQGNQLKGTFLSTTGDYRYLAGEVDKEELRLSTFDGSHAYLFKAKPDDTNKIKGDYWAGKSGYASWTGVRNEKAVLPAADTLTYLKKGYSKISFSFPDLNGQKVSLNDEKYRNKVVVVQLLGSWCPNCMDETKFLAPFYENNKNRGIEIIGLAYEQSPEFEQAKPRVERMRDRLQVGYDLLIAGSRDKDEAAKTLPMLNHVLGFPTTIFIDKKGDVRKIHTGFSGPGTGKYYDEFVQDFNQTIEKLVNE